MGILKTVIGGLKYNINVEVEGEIINPQGTLLLSTYANGGYVGGKYNCAPRYKIDDGLIEVCVIKPVSLLTLAMLIKKYEKGEHLGNKKFDKILTYKQAKKIRVFSNKDFDVSVDGEIYSYKECNMEIVEKAINFAIPE